MSLTKDFRDREQLRFDTYLDFRADGAEFSSKFYDDCDSIFAAMPKEKQSLISAYKIAASMRSLDSTRGYIHPTFFIDMRRIIDAGFDIVGRGKEQ